MKGFFYKLKKKLANINQEAKIGVSIILVALLFFGGVGLTKNGGNQNHQLLVLLHHLLPLHLIKK